MVGDDQIDAESLRCFRGSEGANAHVDANDEANTCCGGSLDHVAAHVVALAYAVGNVEVGCAAAKLDRGLQDNDGHGAVDVVVAVDQDGFFAFDGGVEAVDRSGESSHSSRIVKMGE